MHSAPIRGLPVCPGFLHITTEDFVITGAGFLVVAFGVGILLAVGVGVDFGIEICAETRRFELLKAFTPYLVSSEAHSTGLCDVSSCR